MDLSHGFLKDGVFPDWHFRRALCVAVTNISRSCWAWRWLSRWRQSIHVTWHSVQGQAGVNALVWTQSWSIFALWGGPSHSAYSGGRLTYVGHCTELFSLTEQSGPDVSRRKRRRKHSDKGGWTLPMLSEKPFLHELMPITILPTLGTLFLFYVS